MIVNGTVFKNSAPSAKHVENFQCGQLDKNLETLVVVGKLNYSPGEIVELYSKERGLTLYGKIISIRYETTILKNQVTLSTILKLCEIL